jgi:hypothetical protein
MLEDDYEVDWEVDRDEPITPVHPHRAPLRRRLPSRRPGSPAPVSHDCLSPTFYGRPGEPSTAWATREDGFSARRGSRAGRTETRAARDRHDRSA